MRISRNVTADFTLTMTDLFFVVSGHRFSKRTGHVQFEKSVTFTVKRSGLGYPRRRRASLCGAGFDPIVEDLRQLVALDLPNWC